MSPARLPTRAHWSSGGAILGRCGPLSAAYALELFRFYARQALARHARGDHAAARCCLDLALELADAIVGAADWARAGGADGSLQADRLRLLRRRANSRC